MSCMVKLPAALIPGVVDPPSIEETFWAPDSELNTPHSSLFMSNRPLDDVLSDFLLQSQVRASVFATSSVCGAWRIHTTAMHRLGLHLVARGSCGLHMRGFAAPVPLHAGAGAAAEPR